MGPTLVHVKRLKRALRWAAILFLALVTSAPFLWAFATSLKSAGQLAAFPPIVFPMPPNWYNYYDALTRFPFALFFGNTLLLAGATVLGDVLVSSLVAYGFTWFRFPRRETLFTILVASLALPRVVILVPSFMIFKQLGWIDTYLPMIVPTFLGGNAFHIFLLRQFFRLIPPELVDAAKIDGCGPLRLYWWIVLPLSKPILGLIAIFTFINTWTDLNGPLFFINSESKKTLVLGLTYFKSEHLTVINQLMAATIVSLIPVMLVLFFGQGLIFTRRSRRIRLH